MKSLATYPFCYWLIHKTNLLTSSLYRSLYLTENFGGILLGICEGKPPNFPNIQYVGNHYVVAISNAFVFPFVHRPQTLLQNGLSIPIMQQVRMHQSPVNSAHPSLSSPLHPPPTYHSPSPHSTTPPLSKSHSPHYLHRSNSAASSPATPTNESCGCTSLTTSSRTQPVAPSPSPHDYRPRFR